MHSSETPVAQPSKIWLALTVVCCLLLGLAIGVWWARRGATAAGPNAPSTSEGSIAITLSQATRTALSGLKSPVEIRYFSLSGVTGTPESIRAFAHRVDQLVAQYQQQAPDRIKLSRFAADSPEAQEAARADGIKPFNAEERNACYLGFAVSANGRKEIIPELSPEWEGAVEADLTRAIVRVANAPPLPGAPSAPSPPSPAVFDQVRKVIPDPGAVSLDDGIHILQQASLVDFKAAVQKMEQDVKAAQQQLALAQQSGSTSDQQAAMKHLQQLQAENAEALRLLSVNAQAQIDAFRSLKSGPR